MSTHTRFPVLTEVALAMALSNGAINRYSSAETFLQKLDYILDAEGVYEEDLRAINAWLATLTADERETVADGEETEMEALLAKAPKHTKGLFMDIYNDAVCA